MARRTALVVVSFLTVAFDATDTLAQSGTAFCYATADTRLEQKAPNTNYGDTTRPNADKLWASCAVESIPGRLAESVLRFDLANTSACNLPAGVVINAVRLKANVGDATVDRFGFYEMKKGWTELGATWTATGNGANWQAVGANGTTSPGQDRSATLLASLSNQTTGVKTVPFTTAGRDAVRNWQSTPSSNHGILLRSHVGDAVSSCDDHVWISSRETAAKPHLEIDWQIPTVAITASCPLLQDTNIRQGTPDASYASYPKGWAHSAVDGVGGSWIQALLRFDVSSCLPAGATVSSANLHLHVTNGSPYVFEFYEMLRPFSATATWNAYTTATSWTSHGAMGAGSDFGARLANTQSAPLGPVTIPLSTAIVQGWVGSANRSIVVRPVGAPGTNNAPVGLGFRSSEHTSGSPPILKVVYSTKPMTDTTPPTISNVVVTPGTTTATIRWSTNEFANGRVSYGRTVSYGTNTPLSAGGLTSHAHTLRNLIAGERYYYRILSTDAIGNARTATGDFVTDSDAGPGSTFKIVAWNLHYGKGMTTKAAGMACPVPGLKENPQCQIADDPATPLDERAEERRRSAWGTGLTQRYLNSTAVLDDPEVIALLLTEVNSGTCFSQQDLLNVVRVRWPDAMASPGHRDNWIVARWGFVRGVTNYGRRDIPPCGYMEKKDDGQLVPWPASYSEGIEWGRIYVQDPDPDGDGVLMANPRTLDVFNAHWPLSGVAPDGNKFFCTASATISRDFMNAPAAGLDLASGPRILGGDLNAEDVARLHESASLCEPYGGIKGYDVLRGAGFVDAFIASGTAAVTPTADGSTGMIGRTATESCYRNFSHNGLYMPYKRIDFQWFKGGSASGRNLRVLGFELIGVEQFGNCVPSDHMGTKVQYQWY